MIIPLSQQQQQQEEESHYSVYWAQRGKAPSAGPCWSQCFTDGAPGQTQVIETTPITFILIELSPDYLCVYIKRKDPNSCILCSSNLFVLTGPEVLTESLVPLSRFRAL